MGYPSVKIIDWTKPRMSSLFEYEHGSARILSSLPLMRQRTQFEREVPIQMKMKIPNMKESYSAIPCQRCGGARLQGQKMILYELEAMNGISKMKWSMELCNTCMHEMRKKAVLK